VSTPESSTNEPKPDTEPEARQYDATSGAADVFEKKTFRDEKPAKASWWKRLTGKA
jgi:hypothetical protein